MSSTTTGSLTSLVPPMMAAWSTRGARLQPTKHIANERTHVPLYTVSASLETGARLNGRFAPRQNPSRGDYNRRCRH